MEWLDIITAVGGFIAGGGITAIITLRDKKSSAVLNNLSALIDSADKSNKEWRDIVDERTNRAAELKVDLDKKDDTIERKDKKIDELYAEISELRNKLDERNQLMSALKLLKCERMDCTNRKPPISTFKAIDIETRRITKENEKIKKDADKGNAGSGDAAESGKRQEEVCK